MSRFNPGTTNITGTARYFGAGLYIIFHAADLLDISQNYHTRLCRAYWGLGRNTRSSARGDVNSTWQSKTIEVLNKIDILLRHGEVYSADLVQLSR